MNTASNKELIKQWEDKLKSEGLGVIRYPDRSLSLIAQSEEREAQCDHFRVLLAEGGWTVEERMLLNRVANGKPICGGKISCHDKQAYSFIAACRLWRGGQPLPRLKRKNPPKRARGKYNKQK